MLLTMPAVCVPSVVGGVSHFMWCCRDALLQLLGPVKLHLEELVVERCTDFLSTGIHHFSPLAGLSRLKVTPGWSVLGWPAVEGCTS